jgi:hypothetical protein
VPGSRRPRRDSALRMRGAHELGES